MLTLSLAVIAYAAIHSLLASLRVKAWVRARFGPRSDRWYRIGFNLLALIFWLPVAYLLRILPDQPLYQIPAPWIFLTLAGQALGGILVLVGLLQTDIWHFLGFRQLLTPQVEAETPLTIRGLYRWVRHPLYSGSFLIIWLNPVMTRNLLVVTFWLSVYLVVGAKLEERRLVHAFGDAYRQYQRRVPMFIPRPRFRSP